jgi:hypothetical protein
MRGDAAEVDGAVIVAGLHQVEPPRLLQHAAQYRERLVDVAGR